MTAYVCRDHQDQAVSWHGRDCPTCTAEREAQQRPRRTTADTELDSIDRFLRGITAPRTVKR